MIVQNFSGEHLNYIIAEMNYDINLLYVIPCVYTRNLILNHLRDRISVIESFTKVMGQSVQLQLQAIPFQTAPVQISSTLAQIPSAPLQTVAIPAQTPSAPVQTPLVPAQTLATPVQTPSSPAQQMDLGNPTTFTLQELSRFDGKNGNFAYVAVNGTVYDVTDNAAWAAATHFGLTAGRDLTGAFASCHAGQPILNKLRVVGKLV